MEVIGYVEELIEKVKSEVQKVYSKACLSKGERWTYTFSLRAVFDRKTHATKNTLLVNCVSLVNKPSYRHFCSYIFYRI